MARRSARLAAEAAPPRRGRSAEKPTAGSSKPVKPTSKSKSSKKRSRKPKDSGPEDDPLECIKVDNQPPPQVASIEEKDNSGDEMASITVVNPIASLSIARGSNEKTSSISDTSSYDEDSAHEPPNGPEDSDNNNSAYNPLFDKAGSTKVMDTTGDQDVAAEIVGPTDKADSEMSDINDNFFALSAHTDDDSNGFESMEHEMAENNFLFHGSDEELVIDGASAVYDDVTIADPMGPVARKSYELSFRDDFAHSAPSGTTPNELLQPDENLFGGFSNPIFDICSPNPESLSGLHYPPVTVDTQHSQINEVHGVVGNGAADQMDTPQGFNVENNFSVAYHHPVAGASSGTSNSIFNDLDINEVNDQEFSSYLSTLSEPMLLDFTVGNNVSVIQDYSIFGASSEASNSMFNDSNINGDSDDEFSKYLSTLPAATLINADGLVITNLEPSFAVNVEVPPEFPVWDDFPEEPTPKATSPAAASPVVVSRTPAQLQDIDLNNFDFTAFLESGSSFDPGETSIAHTLTYESTDSLGLFSGQDNESNSMLPAPVEMITGMTSPDSDYGYDMFPEFNDNTGTISDDTNLFLVHSSMAQYKTTTTRVRTNRRTRTAKASKAIADQREQNAQVQSVVAEETMDSTANHPTTETPGMIEDNYQPPDLMDTSTDNHSVDAAHHGPKDSGNTSEQNAQVQSVVVEETINSTTNHPATETPGLIVDTYQSSDPMDSINNVNTVGAITIGDNNAGQPTDSTAATAIATVSQITNTIDPGCVIFASTPATTVVASKKGKNADKPPGWYSKAARAERGRINAEKKAAKKLAEEKFQELVAAQIAAREAEIKAAIELEASRAFPTFHQGPQIVFDDHDPRMGHMLVTQSTLHLMPRTVINRFEDAIKVQGRINPGTVKAPVWVMRDEGLILAVPYGVEFPPYACDRCDRVYRSARALTEHHKTRQHRNVRKSCPICNYKTFTSIPKFYKHNADVHPLLNPCVCACGQAFWEPRELEKHLKRSSVCALRVSAADKTKDLVKEVMEEELSEMSEVESDKDEEELEDPRAEAGIWKKGGNMFRY